MSLTETLFGLFSGMGDPGVVLCIFILFLIDALLFPTLPELFMVLAFDGRSWEFGLVLLAVAIAAELIGVFSLYFVVSRIRVPERISRIANKYIDFLAVSDEKIILLNRVAPMIPFLGAFIAMVDRWDKRKCALYMVIGCVVKYGVILMASGFFSTYLGSDVSQTVTLVFIFAVIVISFALSIYKKRKEGLE
ncbi:MAG: hypothetical protein Q4Q58_03860 [Thermoplasmata archaeon]|nr:hypothetical protein [Thermoplasmata archaeon]